MITSKDIREARERIGDKIVTTPTISNAPLSQELGREIVLKLENFQLSGSFKPRGVFNKLLSLSEEERARKMAAVSGGNFGIAMAGACNTLGIKLSIILPTSAPRSSAEKIEKAGAQVIWEPNVSAAFARAKELKSQGDFLVDDCDDLIIAAGSGTLAFELLEARPDVTDVFMAVGGGSMISGAATALKSINPNIRVWGVEPKGAESMARAIQAGRPVEIDVTSAISTLGVPKIADIFFEHAKALVHRMVVVSDRQAFEGVIELAEKARIWTEPAAGALLAAVRQVKDQLPKDAVVGLVICGGNANVADIMDYLSK